MVATQNQTSRITFIVEGFNDEQTLKQIYPDVNYIITKGRPYNTKIKQALNLALKNKDTILILTDPDEHGDLIAKSIQQHYPYLKRIRIDPDKCRCVRQHHPKIGIEHADLEYLKQFITPYLQ